MNLNTEKNTKQVPKGLEEGHLVTPFRPCEPCLFPCHTTSCHFSSVHVIPNPSLSHRFTPVHFSSLHLVPLPHRKEHQTGTTRAGGRSSRDPISVQRLDLPPRRLLSLGLPRTEVHPGSCLQGQNNPSVSSHQTSKNGIPDVRSLGHIFLKATFHFRFASDQTIAPLRRPCVLDRSGSGGT